MVKLIITLEDFIREEAAEKNDIFLELLATNFVFLQ